MIMAMMGQVFKCEHAQGNTALRAANVVALLFGAGSAWADQAVWHASVAAVMRGDYTAAFRMILPLAKQGDARAQYELASL